MHLSSHPSVQEACCLDIGFRHVFSALALIGVYTARSGFSPCVYTDASQGVELLVGREFAHSLGARLLVSVLRAVGAIFTFALLLTIK